MQGDAKQWLQELLATGNPPRALALAPEPPPARPAFRLPINRRTVAHKRWLERSTTPSRRRRSREGCAAWLSPSGVPDLISLYAALSRITGAQEATR